MFAPPVKVPKAKTTSPSLPTRAPQPPQHRFGAPAGGLSNQAMLWYRSQSAENLTSHKSGGLSQQEAEQALGSSPGAAPSVSWSLSKIPTTFAPDRTSQSQTPRPLIQSKLVVGEVNDPLEHEADRVADQVMRMSAPTHSIAPGQPQLNRKCACGGTCPKCTEEEGNLEPPQMKNAETPEAAAGEVPRIVHDVLRSPGQPLDPRTRAYFEPRFGRDFSQVKIHSGDLANEAAAAVNAKAYTLGSHLVFAAGQYAPHVQDGKLLLAHELAHVVQQSRAGGIDAGQGEAKLGLSPASLHPVLQRQEVTVTLHPEETGVFDGSFRLPFSRGFFFYTVELYNVPPLMLDKRYRDRLEASVELGIRAILNESGRSDPLPSGLPTLRLRLDAGGSRVMEAGYLQAKVRRAARVAMKPLVAQRRSEELERQAEQSRRAKPTPSLSETAPVLAELGSEFEATFSPALEGMKDLIPGVAEAPEQLPPAPVTVEEQEASAARTPPPSCAAMDDPEDMINCMKRERLRFAEDIRKEAANAGEKLATVAEVLNPADPWNLVGAGAIKAGIKGVPLVIGMTRKATAGLSFAIPKMRRYMVGLFRHEPILNKLVKAQRASGNERRRLLIEILTEFEKKEGIPVEFVPEGTVQKARKQSGNYSSLRSSPGIYQIEEQVLQDTDQLMREVRHELAFHYAGGPDNVPTLGESGLNALRILDDAIEHGGEEALDRFLRLEE